MSELIFNSLNEKVKNYIAYNLKWSNFTEIQKLTIPHINAGKDCLIISRTGSGKTEAAFIPVINKIITPAANNFLQCVYIAPLRSLINDMSLRLKKWCENTGATIQCWHSDIASYSKLKFTEKPANILLTTPESIESILFNKSENLKKKLFSKIKFIIIDEIHSFHKSNRGTQLSSLIKRIEKYSADKPQKIGISATVEGPEEILNWMSSSSEENKIIVEENQARIIKVLMKKGGISLIQRTVFNNQDKKILIFARSREECETIALELRKINFKTGIFIHHSSLSREIRETAETQFKNSKAAVMISSGTFELGIDIGNIDFVIHYGEFTGAAAARQRIGRAGRRKNISACLNIIRTNIQFITSLAVLNLINNKKIEQKHKIIRPYDIYLHQILAIISETPGISINNLYEQLSKVKNFSEITMENYNDILQTLKKAFIIEILQNRLYHGKNFEKKFGGANFKNFYAVFNADSGFTVEVNSKIIGTLDYNYVLGRITPGERFTISGNQYAAINIDYKKCLIKAAKISSAQIPKWRSEGMTCEYDIINEAYKIICSDISKTEELTLIDSLDENLKNYYLTLSNKSNQLNLSHQNIYITPADNENKILIITFAGTHINNTIQVLLQNQLPYFRIKSTPFAVEIAANLPSGENNTIIEQLKNIIEQLPCFIDSITDTQFRLIIEKSIPQIAPKSKFTDFLPETLYKDLYVQKSYDLKNTSKIIKEKKVTTTTQCETAAFISELITN